MAKKVHISLEDDIDGSPADETVRFELDGTSYEIDLSKANAEKLRAGFAPYTAVARRTSAPARLSSVGTRSRRSTKIDREQLAHIREWARANGLKVSERGRIPGAVMDAWQEAH